MASSWNSVQIATLAVSALTPLTVAGLGYFVARVSRRLEQVRWANQTVVTRRLEIFSEVAPALNQLLCFGTFVGRWKETQPRDAIGLKRKIDEAMYSNRVLFSDSLFDAYREFMATMFAMFATTEADAHLRAPLASQWGDRRNMAWWQDSMTSLFSPDKQVSTDQIQAAYQQLADRFRADLYVTHGTQPILSTQRYPMPGRPERG
jgi:hypothetical protein